MNPAITLYRIGNFLYRKKLIKLSIICSYLNRFLFSVWIPSSAKIGKNFKLGYGGLGTVIHSNCVIGNNTQINQNVTIGRNFGDIEVPKIGNDVYVGAGSVVFGEIIISDNVIIGANSVVNKDVPPNTTISGNPFIVLKRNRKKKYYEFK